MRPPRHKNAPSALFQTTHRYNCTRYNCDSPCTAQPTPFPATLPLGHIHSRPLPYTRGRPAVPTHTCRTGVAGCGTGRGQYLSRHGGGGMIGCVSTRSSLALASDRTPHYPPFPDSLSPPSGALSRRLVAGGEGLGSSRWWRVGIEGGKRRRQREEREGSRSEGGKGCKGRGEAARGVERERERESE